MNVPHPARIEKAGTAGRQAERVENMRGIVLSLTWIATAVAATAQQALQSRSAAGDVSLNTSTVSVLPAAVPTTKSTLVVSVRGGLEEFKTLTRKIIPIEETL
jgi:hypothetical protein